MSPRAQSHCFILASAAMFSTAGLFMGMLDMPLWSILFWRCAFSLGFTMALIGIMRQTRSAMRFDKDAFVASITSALAMLFFVPSLRMTSVANVAVIHASLPLLTIILAVSISGEGTSWRTTFCCALAAAGAVVIFSGSASSPSRLLGDLLALAMTACMALMTIAFRRSKAPTVLGMVAFSNAMSMVVAAVSADSLAVSLREASLLACFALFQMTLGLVFYARGSRDLPAAETALLSLAEVPLSILWVWIAYGARAPWQTWWGGGVVLLAVVAHLASRRSAFKSTIIGDK